jgi:two-component system, OmpR family, sensor histidine kinase KdpD
MSAFPSRGRMRVRRGIMVCLSSDTKGSEALLRKASRVATDEDAELYVVHVDTPGDLEKLGAEKCQELLDSVMLAADLGAEVIWLKARDVTRALLDFARDARISRIILRRSRPGVKSRLLQRSVTRRLIDRARNVEIEIFGGAAAEGDEP